MIGATGRCSGLDDDGGLDLARPVGGPACRMMSVSADRLVDAAGRGDVDALQTMWMCTGTVGVHVGVWLNYSDGLPLRLAVKNNRLAAAIFLLSRGADVNARRNTGWTALHEAAKGHHHQLIAVLLAAGANVHTISFGMTPLAAMAFAFSVGMGVPICTRCAKLLLAAGARVDDAGEGSGAEPAKENTPLYLAFTHELIDVVVQ